MLVVVVLSPVQVAIASNIHKQIPEEPPIDPLLGREHIHDSVCHPPLSRSNQKQSLRKQPWNQKHSSNTHLYNHPNHREKGRLGLDRHLPGHSAIAFHSPGFLPAFLHY